MVKCGDWGCTPNPYSSHINVIFIKGVWQPLYAMNVHMHVPPPRYGRSCWPSFWNFVRNLGYSQAISDGEMRWLMLYTQPIFISHIIVIHIRDVWQPLYAVDMNMDVSPPRYGRSCWPSFGDFARNLGYSQLISDGETRWLRLQTQPIFISHQCYM